MNELSRYFAKKFSENPARKGRHCVFFSTKPYCCSRLFHSTTVRRMKEFWNTCVDEGRTVKHRPTKFVLLPDK